MSKIIRSKTSKGLSKKEVSQMIKSQMSVGRELKYQTTTYSGTLSSTGAVLNITQPIAQGDNVNNRSGDQINVVEVRLWVHASMNPAAGGDTFRALLVVDTLNLGSSIAVTDVLDTASVSSGINTYSVQSNRFRILMDKLSPMSINGDSRIIMYEKTFKLKDLKVTYTTTSGSYGKNAIYLVILDDLGANNSTYGIGYSIKYHDA